jgi:hypothetical protein
MQALGAGMVRRRDQVIDPVLGRGQLIAAKQQCQDNREISGKPHAVSSISVLLYYNITRRSSTGPASDPPTPDPLAIPHAGSRP